MTARAETFLDVVRRRAERHPDELAYTFLHADDARNRELTYGELDHRARAAATAIRREVEAGDRVLLALPSGLGYVTAFFGCLYAGAVAVPANLPRRTRMGSGAGRLRSIVDDARPSLALTTRNPGPRLPAAALRDLAGGRLAVRTIEDLDPSAASRWRPPGTGAEDVMLLQYTSGSTAAPRGVAVGHDNVLHNQRAMSEAFGHGRDTVVVGWLPMFHDMGLVGNVLQPVFVGGRCVLMPPAAFTHRPVRWLRAVTRYRATTSGGPNFAYDLCADRIRPEQRRELDLSSWRVAFNGAEPVRAATLHRFGQVFAPCGFRREAFFPCYGLAEATLMVAGSEPGRAPVTGHFDVVELERGRAVPGGEGEEGARELVSSGQAVDGTSLRVVDPEERVPCDPGEVGEVWVAGGGVARGYLGRPEVSEEVFRARLTGDDGGGDGETFLRTGDLGFLQEGELYVVGRRTDMVVVRGRNHHPHDLEATARRSHPDLRPKGGAAFAVDDGSEERLVLVHEVRPRARDFDPSEAAGRIREAVAEEHRVSLHAVVFIRAGTLPKTSSGKIRRSACREAHLQGELDELGRSVLEGSGAAVRPDLSLSGEELRSAAPDERRELVHRYLRLRVARALDRPREEVDPSRSPAALGLDSMAAVEVKHRVERDLDVRLPTSALLGSAALTELADWVLTEVGRDPPGRAPAPPERTEEAVFPASHGQRSLLFLQRLVPDSTAYHIVRAVRVRGPLDTKALESAFGDLVRRHDAFRTLFRLGDGRPEQRVGEEPVLEVRHVDAGDWGEETLRRRAEAAGREAFDLEGGPLVRVSLYRRSDREHLMLLAAHHALLDLWSLGIVLEELEELYAARSRGERTRLPAPEAGYADFVTWQADWIESDEGAAAADHWASRLEGLEPLRLPTDRPRPPARRFRGGRHELRIPAEVSEPLAALCRGEGATLFHGILVLFRWLLHRYAGQDDFAIGVPAHGRARARFERVVGYFVNPLPLRGEVRPGEGFRAAVARARDRVLEDVRHQHFPFELMVERRAPARDPSVTPLFQAMLVMQDALVEDRDMAPLILNTAGPARAFADDLELESVPVDAGGAQFDLGLWVAQSAGGLEASLEYDRDLFDADTVRRMANHLGALAEAVVEDPDVSAAAAPMMTREERNRVLVEWNATDVSRPGDLRLDRLVAERTRSSPEAVALTFEGADVTYGELDRRSARVSRRLRDVGVGRGDVVAVAVERCVEMVAGLLGVLRAGAAYLPLDPEDPPPRIRHAAEDAGVEACLTLPGLRADLPEMDRAVLDLRSDAPPAGRGPRPVAGDGGPSDLAYVMYTSGSTGRPKGVAVPHRGICHRLLGMRDALGVGPHDVILHKTPYTFDVSAWEIFLPLICGARLVLAAPGAHRDPRRLARLIKREGVTTLHFVPSMLRGFLEVEPFRELGASPERVICSGETLTARLRDRFFSASDAELHNYYGPTEASIDVTSWRCERDDPAERVPIGRPVPGTRVYVLDGRMEPVPPGVLGELYIGGAQLARGYVGRPALTARCFVPDPFSAGGRLYRTGDLARLRSDGVVEFMGRTDRQVQIRGHRVELGEVEAALERHPDLAEAAVRAAGGHDGDRRLVAYGVPRGSPAPDIRDVRDFLRERLPDYMQPAAWLPLEEMPLTSSGKLDRDALPEPDRSRPELDVGFEPPGTATERTLAAIWEEVLELDGVGIRDSFFDLGGDSIRSIQVVSRARREGLHLSLEDLFLHQTIGELAGAVDGSDEESLPVRLVPPFGLMEEEDRGRLPSDVEDAYPLSVVQQGLVFHAELGQEYELYLTTLRIRASWDRAAMRRALDHVTDRHPVLRISYDLVSFDVPVQRVHQHAEIPLRVVDLRGKPGDAREGEIEAFLEAEKKREVAWSSCPLMRLTVHRLEDGVFQLTRSDPVLDGWSVALFLSELLVAYAGLLEGEDLPGRPPPASTFRDFVALERRALEAPDFREHWESALADASLCELPRPDPGSVDPPGASRVLRVTPEIPAPVSRKLRKVSRTSGVPLKSVLMAAHLRVLGHLSGRTHVVTGVVVNGRPEQRDAARVLGSYLNMMPLNLRVDGGSWRELARRTFDRERALLPFRRYPMAELQRRNGRRPLFEAVFNFTHFHPYRAVESVPSLEILEGDSSEQTYFPLTTQFNVDHRGGGIRFALDYSSAEFTREQVEEFGACYVRALTAFAREPDAGHADVSLLSDRQRRLAAEWNDTATCRAGEPLVPERVARRAREAPGSTALVHGRRRVSYGELDGAASGLARRLRALGVGTESRVALCLDRSPEFVLGALAVMKAGGAFVPLDPRHPPERLEFMIRDAGSEVVLMAPSGGTPAGVDATVIPLDRDAAWEEGDGDGPVGGDVRPDQLAYVVYTSGSTGRPKGVAVPHRALRNLVSWYVPEYGLGRDRRVSQVARPGFDAWVAEIWPALSAGSEIHFADDPTRLSPDAMRSWILEEEIGVAYLPTPLAEPLLGPGWPEDAPLRHLLTGGDRLHRHPGVDLPFRVVNQYGPAENAVWATTHDVATGVEHDRPPPIGTPLPNVRVHVVDRELRRVPPGTPGELCLAGGSVGRGYARRPRLTAERFVPDPFSPDPGARLYRTGDLGRRRPDGSLEFLGRMDRQVQLRGQRVELGEIEAVLAGHEEVAEAVVTCRGSGADARLVAYVTAPDGRPPEPESLRHHSRVRLPDFMVPSAWVVLDALPLTTNGKIDRAALPAPGKDGSDGPHVAPRTELEADVARIWADVLEVPRVGALDDFFELGGHSLLATRVVTRIRAEMDADVPLSLLFDAPRLEEFAEAVGRRRRAQEEDLREVIELVEGLSDREVRARLEGEADDG